MDDCQLENLAIKEIIEEIERKKRNEIQSQSKIPPRLNVRPNKRFLGRTIESVLQHNKRQQAQERKRSFRKLRELDRSRRSPYGVKSEKYERNVRKSPSLEERDVQEQDHYCHVGPEGLSTYLLGNMQQWLENAHKTRKKKKKKSKTFTIDLTTKKKRAKEKRKQRTQQKSNKSKKSKRKKKKKNKSNSSSPSSTNSSICQLSESDDGNWSESSTLLIDLTRN